MWAWIRSVSVLHQYSTIVNVQCVYDDQKIIEKMTVCLTKSYGNILYDELTSQNLIIPHPNETVSNEVCPQWA